MIREKLGSFNKTKVFNLPISENDLANAIARSRNNYNAADIIPNKPKLPYI